MGRIFASLGMRFVVELVAGLQQLHETIAVQLGGVGFPDAGSAAIHANLDHRLIIGDLQVPRLRDYC